MMPRKLECRDLSDIPAWKGNEPPTRIRVFADAYIPWKCVNLPTGIPYKHLFSPINWRFDMSVHGDDRGPVRSSVEVQSKYRLRSMIEFDVVENEPDVCSCLKSIQISSNLSQIAGSVMRFRQGIPLFRMKDTGTLLNDTVKARRIDQGTVEAKLVISGKVPFKIAPWQPSIDYSYIVRVWQEPKSGRVHWEVNANHDGFPSHEFFIESLGGVIFSKSYEPIWFSDTNSKTAFPSPFQAIKGMLALSGKYHKVA